MTIHWNPSDETNNPDNIDIWHVQPDGTVTGPVSIQPNGLNDSIGGIAPNAVRERLIDFLRNGPYSPSDTLWQEVAYDMLGLDYERGQPPA